MTDHNLLPEEVFYDLPDDPAEQFLSLVRIAEANFLASNATDLASLRRQFVNQIQMIARELKIEGLPVVSRGPVTVAELVSFQNDLTTVKSKIHLRRGRQHGSSVQLSVSARAHIEIEIERLRGLVDSSDLPEGQKKKIGTKLDELLEELHRKRLGFTKVLTVAAAIAGILGGSASAVTNGPEAMQKIGNILHWVGREIESEQTEQLRLNGPAKALPPPMGEVSGESGSPVTQTRNDQKEAF